MEPQRTSSMGASTFKWRNASHEPASGRVPPREKTPDAYTTRNSLVIGAKTLAGIGIGLLAVSGGFLLIGALAEAAVVPSLLLKLAGGLTGGGLGMAKGLKDASKSPEE